ncbi:9289_t:CDS:2 [Dentiscutata erythropus]|uniref:9289_t:CDS:1 n=1 Tax=Dentiscutata erythropus TaxID=1348616 RepID=A0A9N9AHZ2_9GLOM|nr:9289_t:CDS:2 [Dentiscutata erythropus]
MRRRFLSRFLNLESLPEPKNSYELSSKDYEYFVIDESIIDIDNEQLRDPAVVNNNIDSRVTSTVRATTEEHELLEASEYLRLDRDPAVVNNNIDFKNIRVTSMVRATTEEQMVFQDFYLSVIINAKVISVPNEEYSKVLKCSVNLTECGVGRMLSEISQKLCRVGTGYFLDSVVIKFSPTPKNHSDSIPRMIAFKVNTQPQQPNQTMKVSTIREKNKGIKGQISVAVPKFGIQVGGNYYIKNALGTETMKCEQDMKFDGCYTTGNCWTYNINNFRESGSYNNNFAPGIHSDEWHILDAMGGNNINDFENYFAKLNEVHVKQKALDFLESDNFNESDTQRQEGIDDFTVTRTISRYGAGCI